MGKCANDILGTVTIDEEKVHCGDRSKETIAAWQSYLQIEKNKNKRQKKKIEVFTRCLSKHDKGKKHDKELLMTSGM